MARCFFVSDLHGDQARYDALVAAIRRERPAAVFLGGDLLPHSLAAPAFFAEHLVLRFERLRRELGAAYPQVFLIFGNDDPRSEEAAAQEADRRGLWTYAHYRRAAWEGFDVVGYAYVPPTPFGLKDWERYDVSHYVEPGCSDPADGWRTALTPQPETPRDTIREDFEHLAAGVDMERAILLVHTPPYRTALDRAALDGKSVDHAPVDVHVGSIAVRRFIEARQPLLTLHGHVHESARLTGSWRERIGRTHAVSAAHDGPELALVRFDPDDLEGATRELV